MDTEISIVRAFLSLLVVVGLIGLSALVLRWLSDKSLKIRQMGAGKRLKLIEVAVLDHKHKLFLFRCDDEEYTVISNGTEMQVLSGGKESKDV